MRYDVVHEGIFISFLFFVRSVLTVIIDIAVVFLTHPYSVRKRERIARDAVNKKRRRCDSSYNASEWDVCIRNHRHRARPFWRVSPVPWTSASRGLRLDWIQRRIFSLPSSAAHAQTRFTRGLEVPSQPVRVPSSRRSPHKSRVSKSYFFYSFHYVGSMKSVLNISLKSSNSRLENRARFPISLRINNPDGCSYTVSRCT